MKIDGKHLANEILENLKLRIRNTQHANTLTVVPTMAVILVGDNPASLSYIKQKQKSAEKIGAKVILKEFSQNISQIELINLIKQINSDPNIHGIIIQRPLPPTLCHSGLACTERSECDPESILINTAVSPSKDIDAFHPESKFLSPVGLAVLYSLYFCHSGQTKREPESINIDSDFHQNDDFFIRNTQFVKWLNSQNILLIGRGETGGKPIANTLDKLKIKHTQTHSKTSNTKELLKQADIIISAIGKPNLISGNMIKKEAICIGVGISRSPVIASPIKDETKQSHFNLTGDFEETSISQVTRFYTPTPGGIGPLTVAFLLDNLIKAWENKSL